MDAPILLRIDLRLQRIPNHSLNGDLTLYNIYTITEPSAIDSEIRKTNPIALCFDCDYPNMSDLKLLRQTIIDHPTLPTLFVTEWHSESLAVWAFRTGVWDYLTKPLAENDLPLRIGQLKTLANAPIDQIGRKLLFPIPHDLRFGDSVANKCTSAAISFIHDHIHEKISITSMAKLCAMSVSQFSRAFRQEHKQTFQEFLLHFRIDKAKQLLVIPHISVSDVAFATGFNDLSYFSRIFRRFTGVAPSAFRTQMKSSEINH